MFDELLFESSSQSYGNNTCREAGIVYERNFRAWGGHLKFGQLFLKQEPYLIASTCNKPCVFEFDKALSMNTRH